jgi:hypothetical protein
MAVTISSGANARPVEGLEGKTVSEIRTAFEGLYGIHKDAVATLNGSRAEGSDTVTDGDELAFTRRVAQKGA